jgi:hypothetical protein
MEPADEARRGGGDPACWAHLVCPECGAIEAEGHRAECRFGQSAYSAGSDAGSDAGSSAET